MSEVLLVDARGGVYIPQMFTKIVEQNPNWKNINQEDIDVLRMGPDHDDYWHIWDYVLDSAFYVDKNDHVWVLSEDEDLWLVQSDENDVDDDEHLYDEP